MQYPWDLASLELLPSIVETCRICRKHYDDLGNLIILWHVPKALQMTFLRIATNGMKSTLKL